jgi:outer membrane biosynthesis protein TonB
MTVREDRETTPLKRRLATGGVVLTIALLLAWGIYRAMTSVAVIPKKVVPDVVQMRLVQPPPPPPPPPRPKMEEQPKDRAPVERPTPLQNVPPPPNNVNAAPPGPLALDTQGQGAPDPFGLAGRPGGSDILGGGGGGGGGGSAYGWYAGILEGRIQDLLKRDRRLRGRRYEGAVSLRLAPDGKPLGVELIQETGTHEVDQLIAEDLSQWKPPQPPQGMPQPIVIKLRSH